MIVHGVSSLRESSKSPFFSPETDHFEGRWEVLLGLDPEEEGLIVQKRG